MHQRFEQQMSLWTVVIADVKFRVKSRDELPPVLKDLQHVCTTADLNKKVFTLLEEKICQDKKKTGRKGMDLWHIMVLAVMRHALDTNWHRLHHQSNYDKLLWGVMGIHATAFIKKKNSPTSLSSIMWF